MSCIGSTTTTTHLHVLFQACMNAFDVLFGAYVGLSKDATKDLISEAKMRDLKSKMQQWGRSFGADQHCSSKQSLDHQLRLSESQKAQTARELAGMVADIDELKGMITARRLDPKTSVAGAQSSVNRITAATNGTFKAK
ncbi:hypothetical protein B0T10DRAFT_270540 [Thelonectria olida]|uniref:Uncharacterized protein n=1 Tax=Thelonectria olida TaxID=1576542 RepID=A0A9P8W9L1_9HYPO|nr:hypothetical protein B0T10DRAFT_270540 [Thelonectria olida]